MKFLTPLKTNKNKTKITVVHTHTKPSLIQFPITGTSVAPHSQKEKKTCMLCMKTITLSIQVRGS